MSTNFYNSLCGKSGRPGAIPFVHAALASVVRKGAFVVDATAGNGYDTLHLARLTAPGGNVLAFDIQPSALDATRKRCADCDSRIETVLRCHSAMQDRNFRDQWPARPAAVVFNLGYLPGGDKTLITSAETTLAALGGALEWLAPDGIITIVCYPGHTGGELETSAVERWAASLASETHTVCRFSIPNTRRPAPLALLVGKPSSLTKAKPKEEPAHQPR